MSLPYVFMNQMEIRDSKDVDRIALTRLEYRGEGGIRIPLSHPRF